MLHRVLSFLYVEPKDQLDHNKCGHSGTIQNLYTSQKTVLVEGFQGQCKQVHYAMLIPVRIRLKIVKYAQLHFTIPRLAMQFISMNLIGPFDPPSNGHWYVLTVICMLTGYKFCVSLKTKSATEVVQAYVGNVYARFGGSTRFSLTMKLNLQINWSLT